MARLADEVDLARNPSRSFVAATLNNMILALNMDLKKVRSEMEKALGRMDIGKLPKRAKLDVPVLRDIGKELGIDVFVGLHGGDFTATVDGVSAYETPVGEFSPQEAASAMAGAIMGAIGEKAFN